MKFIEALIVVVVISVLSMVTFNQFDVANKKARDVQRKNDLREVAKSIQMFYGDYGYLPGKGLSGEFDINKLWGKEFVDNEYVYMKSVPKENYLDTPYCYEPGKSNLYFRLFAQLENNKDFDCLSNLYTCGEKSYCYTDIIYVDDK